MMMPTSLIAVTWPASTCMAEMPPKRASSLSKRPAAEEMQPADVAARGSPGSSGIGAAISLASPDSHGEGSGPGRTIVARSPKIARSRSGRLQRPRQIRSGKPPSFMNDGCRRHSGPAQAIVRNEGLCRRPEPSFRQPAEQTKE